jgi:hypothetical protein
VNGAALWLALVLTFAVISLVTGWRSSSRRQDDVTEVRTDALKRSVALRQDYHRARTQLQREIRRAAREARKAGSTGGQPQP